MVSKCEHRWVVCLPVRGIAGSTLAAHTCVRCGIDGDPLKPPEPELPRLPIHPVQAFGDYIRHPRCSAAELLNVTMALKEVLDTEPRVHKKPEPWVEDEGAWLKKLHSWVRAGTIYGRHTALEMIAERLLKL